MIIMHRIGGAVKITIVVLDSITFAFIKHYRNTSGDGNLISLTSITVFSAKVLLTAVLSTAQNFI